MRRVFFSALSALAVATAPAPAAALSASYLYNLATTGGPVRSSWPSVIYEPQHDEVFVVTDGFVRIFNRLGMQVHSFGDEDETGVVRSVAVLDDGDILVVATQHGRTVIHRCSYRGEPLSKFTPTGVPADFAGKFDPDTVVYRKGLVYLADRGGLKILVTDTEGAFKASYDLAKILGQKQKSEKKHGSSEDLSITGFCVDDDGNLLLTAPVLFYVFVVSPRGEVTGFGTRGSTAGKFNIIGGITTDAKGNIWVTDTLRAVVLVFTKQFEYLGEFGYRGYDRGALVAPLELAVGKDGKVFVAQSADRGVSVFRVSFDQ